MVPVATRTAEGVYCPGARGKEYTRIGPDMGAATSISRVAPPAKGEGREGAAERFLMPQVPRSPVEKVAVRSGERVRVEVGGREGGGIVQGAGEGPRAGEERSGGIKGGRGCSS